MGFSTEDPFVLDGKEDKNSPLKTPVAERPTGPLVLMRSRRFGTRVDNIPDFVSRKLFECFGLLLCMYFDMNYNLRVSFYHNFFREVVNYVSDKSNSGIVIIIFTGSSKCLHISSTYREQNSENKTQCPCENEYKKYWLKGGKCCYLVDESIVGYNCS